MTKLAAHFEKRCHTLQLPTPSYTHTHTNVSSEITKSENQSAGSTLETLW